MLKYLPFLISTLLLFGCHSTKISETNKITKTENLTLQQITEHVYQHTSFLQTESFGKVSCNGMIVFNKNEAIIFDTPPDNKTSLELINWVEQDLHCQVKAIIPTHFHSDCLGGLEEFHKHNIPSYANNLTVKTAQEKNLMVPQNGFSNFLELKVGGKKVIAEYFGEGHTKDNIIGYFPDEKIMFGGCLIKELSATKGNLEDANTTNWPVTVTKLKEKYSNLTLIIPGHGKPGGTELLDYTINLFAQK
ncbi:subclass B1 metallo-beta-lactamase [Adhaeribacter radiodurans]|uniref:beta-lactamase n=1 Tax=Adhaeribacter radiodurans TaxID=2745197 RepID=A0A7L7L4D5_9BACT|nr:subclass B1 metallo-beta-lactamase [Adhaeribacter radiodurans]QMU27239.1 subclass B1 metallo-beta-lactamase [Adhaeribacter radiodurans]